VRVAVSVDFAVAVEQTTAVPRHDAVAVSMSTVVLARVLVFTAVTGTGSNAVVDGGRSLKLVAVHASHGN